MPNLTTRHFHKLKVKKTILNLKLPEIIIQKEEIYIPKIGVKEFSGIKSRKKAFNPIIKFASTDERSKEKIKEILISKETTSITPDESEKSEKELELLDFFELSLGKGIGRISEGKPICIIVEKTEERYEELIATLCRDIFREKEGGKPKPIYRDSIKELRGEFESLVERRIIVVKEVKSSSRELTQLLEGFFSQDRGFLILVSPEPSKLEEEFEKSEEFSANIITVSSRPEIEREEERKEILETIRGVKSPIQVQSLGEEFKRSAEAFDGELVRKYSDYRRAPSKLKEDWDRLTACSPDDYAQASDVHSAMKAFAWIYEWKKSGKKSNPELEADRGEDVKFEDKNYEIETLFGVGDIISKLTEKIKKYGEGEKIYFVLRNLDILRNLSLLSSFRKKWRKTGYNVNFFGLDLDKEEFIPLDRFRELTKSLLSEQIGSQ